MKKILLALMLLLVGCTQKYTIVKEYNDSILYYSKNEEFIYKEALKIIDDDIYYNVYYNARYIVEYDGVIYQTYDEIVELLSIIGPEELYKIGYRMERIPLDYKLWERNYNVEDYNY